MLYNTLHNIKHQIYMAGYKYQPGLTGTYIKS